MYSILLRVALQSVNLIVVGFAYFFTFSFFKETPVNGCFRHGVFTNKTFDCFNV